MFANDLRSSLRGNSAYQDINFINNISCITFSGPGYTTCPGYTTGPSYTTPGLAIPLVLTTPLVLATPWFWLHHGPGYTTGSGYTTGPGYTTTGPGYTTGTDIRQTLCISSTWRTAYIWTNRCPRVQTTQAMVFVGVLCNSELRNNFCVLYIYSSCVVLDIVRARLDLRIIQCNRE